MIEVLVVMTVIGLLLVAALPRLGYVPEGIEARRAESAVRDAFGAASHLALAGGQAVDVRFAASDTAWQVVRSRPGVVESTDERDRLEVIYAKLNHFPVSSAVTVDVVDDASTAEVAYAFYPDGSAYGPGTTMRLGARAWSLEVDRLTGRPILTRSVP